MCERIGHFLLDLRLRIEEIANNAGAPPEQLQAIEDKYAPAPGRFKNATGDEIGMVPAPKAGGEVYSDDGRVIDQV